ncbi:MAG: hypothetical protein QXD23_01480 [Candidatus Micrarchaeaceae archaeon]
MTDIPKWMIAQEILIKAKNELILEAIDTLHKEVKENRLQINGNVIKLPDKSSEIEMDMLIINNLLEQEQQIVKNYGKFIKEKEDSEKDPLIVERINELKKFLMSVTQIKILMNFAKTIDEWVLDFANSMNINNVPKIISETAKRNVERIELLSFIIDNKKFYANEALNEEEIKNIKEAYELCK